MAKAVQYMRCKEGFLMAAPPGQSRGRAIKAGTVLPATDPAVLSAPTLFIPLETHLEQATANPGQLRATTPKAAKQPETADEEE